MNDEDVGENAEAFPVGTVMTVYKGLSVDTGHLLRNKQLTPEENKEYFGHCNTVHGHTLHIHIYIEGPVQDKSFMVINLGKVKAKLAEIINELDHNSLQHVLNYSTDDTRKYRAPATSEHCCYWVYKKLQPYVKELNPQARIKKVKAQLNEAHGVEYKPKE